MQVKCEHDKLEDIHKVIDNPKNPNKHDDKQVGLLAKLIDYTGFRHPIIVSKRSGFIVAGHGRLLAAKKLGYEQVPVDYQDFKDEAEEFAIMVADNKVSILAEHDDAMMIDLLKDIEIDDYDYLGIPDFEMPETEVIQQCDEDAVPEQVDTRCKKGDVWLLGEHRLMCGDSTSIDDVDKLMDGAKADMVFTDPPYGIGLDKKELKLGKSQVYNGVTNDDSSQCAVDAFNLCESLEIPFVFFWGANHYSASLPDSSCWLVWDKQGGKSVTYADCELCYTNLKKPVRMFTHIWDGFRRDSEKGETRVHPTQKPVQLFIDIFDKFELPNKTLDLFGGSGSTLIACEKTNRKCFMMELDEHYCDVILARWEKYTGKEATLENQV